jgi:hypothetical protein
MAGARSPCKPPTSPRATRRLEQGRLLGLVAVEYEILEAQVKKQLPATGQRGPLTVWSLKLRGPDGNVEQAERNKKPGNELVIGQRLYGYIEEDQYGNKFKEVQDGRGGAPNGAGGKREKQYERSADHPLTIARMRHTSAMSAAPDYYRLFREESVIPKPTSKAEMVETLNGVMTWLEGTYPPDPREQA